MNKQKKAFTLVELIVVITILAILWTIAFISFQWYSKQARDSRRISDIANIKTSLELFILNSWYYPQPDIVSWWSWAVYYSWDLLWIQWSVWNNVTTNLSKNLPNKPLDPLFEIEYTYSVTNNNNEYQVMALYELEISNNNLIDYSYASNIYNIKLDWTYNEVFVKTPNYIFPSPSIITSEELPFDFVWNSQKLKSQVVTNWDNFLDLGIPGTNIQTWSLSNMELFATWTITKDSSKAQKESVISSIQSAYTWTELVTKDIYKTILNTTEPEILADRLILHVYNTESSVSEESGWSGLISQTDCESANWMWVDSAIDVYIWSTRWDWFCISPRYWDWWDSVIPNNMEWISYNWWWQIYGWWNTFLWHWQTLTLQWANSLSVATWYACKSLWTATADFDTTDNLLWRMKWLASTWNSSAESKNIDWITGITLLNNHSVPALFIADCIDGIKDLWEDMTYIHSNNSNNTITYSDYNTDNNSETENIALSNAIYQNRQKYLLGWTQQSGSHLPSAFTYIDSWTPWWCWLTTCDNLPLTEAWEYQVACEGNKLTDSDDNIDNEQVWLAAIGWPNGQYWGDQARMIWNNWCKDQLQWATWWGVGILSARFVVRP
jgi:prepilin-type N-terminal cleavage/methylation domain-containing protein